MQELKAQEADLSDDMKNPHGMHGYWHCAEKRGYSGVAVYSKRKPDNVQIGMGIEEFDREGRFVRCDFFHYFSSLFLFYFLSFILTYFFHSFFSFFFSLVFLSIT